MNFAIIWSGIRVHARSMMPCSGSALGQFTGRGGLPAVTARTDRFIAEGGKGP
jgi:hypothetical protein